MKMKIMKLNSSSEMILLISFVLVGILNKSMADAADMEQMKIRRGGTAGLFAFPRVGRNDPSLSPSNWIIPGSYEEYDDFPRMEMKRAGLVPFPRVGRADNQLRNWSKMAALQQQQQQQMDKKSDYDRGLSYSERLGSRFGKIQKRSIHNNYDSLVTGEHL